MVIGKNSRMKIKENLKIAAYVWAVWIKSTLNTVFSIKHIKRNWFKGIWNIYDFKLSYMWKKTSDHMKIKLCQ